MRMNRKAQIVVLASGAGSTFAAIADACGAGRLDAQVSALIVSRDNIGALDVAKLLNIPAKVVSLNEFLDRESWDQALTLEVAKYNPEWVVLAGFNQLLGHQFLCRFEGRVINTHPSLLPKYGGKGMYGMRVHGAVLQAGDKETGITVHLVTADYDEGPILAQTKVPVVSGDTPESLAERLKAIERDFYVATLQELVSKSKS